MSACVCSYYNCLNGLYLAWKQAIGTNPAKAKEYQVKISKATAILALYQSAVACGDTTKQTVQCTRLRNLFAGDVCLEAGTIGDTPTMESGSFDNADLVGGVLTIVHSLGTTLISQVTIIDPDDTSESVSFTVVDSSHITVNFGGAIGAGTFTYIITALPSV